MNELLSNTRKKYESRYFQLKVGQGVIRTFLAKIGVRETPEYWWCGQGEQSVEHLYTMCREVQKKEKEACEELKSEKC